jgi:hypothetical protein
MAGIDGNTKSMLHFDGAFTDVKGHIVTPNGDAKIHNTKFGGGAINFNGTTQYLTVPDSTDWNLFDAGHDFTIDLWAKHVATTGGDRDYVAHFQDSNNMFQFRAVANDRVSCVLRIGGTFHLNMNSASFVLNIGSWDHIVLARVGSDLGLYVNGIQVAYGSHGGNYNLASPLYIGQRGDSTGYMNGNIDELRIQHNNALSLSPNVGLTDTFTVPTSPHVSDANTKLLLHLNGNLDDSSNASHNVTSVGDPFIAGPKFGSGAGCFNGVNQYLTIPDHDDFDIFGNASSDYVVDFWINPSDTLTEFKVLSQKVDDDNRYQLYHTPANGFTLLVRTGAVSIINNISSGAPITDRVWTHIALIKKGNDYGIYVNGVQTCHVNTVNTATFASDISIGREHNQNSSYFNGDLDGYRIQKSDAFSASPNVGLTDTITVPTAEHSADANTVLLINFNGDFSDASLLDHTVTNLGDTDLVGPRVGIGAVNFNGVDEYLTVADNNGFNFADSLTGDYTIDFWIKHNPLAGVVSQYYVWQGDNGYNQQWYFRHDNGAAGLSFVVYNNPSYYANYNTNVKILDTDWHHLALIKIDDKVGIYMDGVQVGYVVITSALATPGELAIGAFAGNTPGQSVDGMMDDFHMTKVNHFSAAPNVGLTDTITIPVVNHTVTVDTQLLLHFDGDFTDESNSDHSVSVIGNTSLATQKFGTGSLRLNGTDQYLSIPTSSDFDILDSNSSDRTIDFWFKSGDGDLFSGVQETFMHQGQDPDANYWQLITSAGDVIAFNGLGVPTSLSTTTGITDSNWHHLALIKKGSEYGIYLDGQQEGYGTGAGTLSGLNSPLAIGCRRAINPHLYFEGLMDEIRIQHSNAFSANPDVGNTDTITVPTAQHVADANTKLLLHLDGDVFDSGNSSHGVCVIGNSIIGTPKFGTGSGVFNGVDDYLSISDHDDWNIASDTTEDYTIDLWVKLENPGVVNEMLVDHFEAGPDRWHILYDKTNGLDFSLVTAGGTAILMQGGLITDLNWHHVAFVKVGGSPNAEYAFYIDGVQTAYVSDSSTDSFTGDLNIGRYGGNGNYLDGQLDELRIEKFNAFTASPNVGLTDTITVPTGEHTDTANTKLLLHFNVDPIVDSSNRGHAVSTVGDAKSVTPYLGSGAASFNGVDQHLSVADSPDWDVFASATEDWTIDFWVKHSDLPTSDETYVVHHEDNSNNWLFRRNPSGFIDFFLTVGGTIVLRMDNSINPSGTKILDTAWHHVALCKVQNDYGIYLDGNQTNGIIGDSDVGDFTGLLGVGAWVTRNIQFMKGQMDELRIQKSNAFSATPNGSFNDTITVPTVAYTPDANTQLLLHFDGDFTDSSTNGHDVTNINSSDILGYKFGTGAGYFDGIDDHLSLEDSNDWDVIATTTEDWTIDFWVKHDSNPATERYISHEQDSNNYWKIYRAGGSKQVIFITRIGGGANKILIGTGNDTMPTGSWNHVAVIKKADEYGIYINGIQLAYVQNTDIASFNGSLKIGTDLLNDELLHGSLDELRIQKSDPFSASPNAFFTDTITVPTSAHTADANTKLLLHFDGNFKDDSGLDHGVTQVGNAGFATFKVGTGATYFDGIDDYLAIPNSSDFDIIANNTDSWTVDFWMKTGLTNNALAFEQAIDGSNAIRLNTHSAGSLQVFIRVGGPTQLNYITATGVLTADQWNHVAFVINGTGSTKVIGIYVDGTQVGYTTLASNHTLSPSTFYIGANALDLGGTAKFDGQLDEYRIQKSNAFSAAPVPGLTDTITVPTANHVADANTKLLLHFDGNFKDDSGLDHTVSVFGDAVTGAAKFGGGSARLGGNDRYLSIPDSSDFDMLAVTTEDYTLDTFIRFRGAYSGAVVEHIGVATPNFSGWTLYHTAGVGFRFESYVADVLNISVNGTGSPITDDNWHHVAIVKKGGINAEYGIYIDGVQVAFAVSSLTHDFNGELIIGASRRGSIVNEIPANLDDFRIQKSNIYSASPNIGKTDTITVPTIEAVKDGNTKLLLNFNTDFTDSSDSAHTVTPFSTVFIQTSVFGDSSAIFDGTGDYLSIPDHTDFAFGTTDDFSIDLWFRKDAAATQMMLVNKRTGVGFADGEINLIKQSNDLLSFGIYDSNGGGGNLIANSAAGIVADFDWHHVYAERSNSGTVLAVYYDGVQVAYATGSAENATSTGNMFIGSNSSPAIFLFGQMDDLRISDITRFGATPNVGLTDTITVPTVEHTTDANTKLLLNFNETPIADTSNTGHPVTAINGSRLISPVFGTGCGTFDGTSDYLSLADSDDWNVIGSVNDYWTIDAWIYPEDSGKNNICFQGNDGVPWNYWEFFVSGNDLIFDSWIASAQQLNIVALGVLNIKQWTHVTCVINGTGSTNEGALYVNGVQVAYSTNSSTADFPNDLGIGRSRLGGNRLNGLLDEVRIQKSNAFGTNPVVGLTDTFTVPTAEHTSDANTKLLLHFDADPIVDSSNVGHSVTEVSGPFIVGAKFGENALSLNGTTQYLSVADSADWDIFANNTEDFTVDLWVKLNGIYQDQYLIAQYADANSRWYISCFQNAGPGTEYIQFGAVVGGVFTILSSSAFGVGIGDDNWHHIALVKKSSEYGVYLDGTQAMYLNDSDVVNVSSPLFIGHNGSIRYLNGQLDEVRVQKSDAFSASPNIGLTDTITVPTAAYTADANTKLLMHFDVDPIVDDSGSGHAVTIEGGAVIASPKFGVGDLLLDGDGDYLSIPDSDDWDLVADNTTDRTMDFWVKHAEVPTVVVNYIAQEPPSPDGWELLHTPTQGIAFQWALSGVNKGLIHSGVYITDTDWHHIALVIIGNGANKDLGLYLDGIQIGYLNTTETQSYAAALLIGGRWNNTRHFEGQMDELRISDNNYFATAPNIGLTDTITVPTAAYTADANTQLLLHFDGNPIVDSSGTDHPISINNGVVVSNPKIGEGALELDASGDLLTIANSPVFDFGTDDFTIEMWIYVESIASRGGLIWNGTLGGLTGFGIRVESDETIVVMINGQETVFAPAFTTALEKSWQHIAVVRDGVSSWRFFLNGVEVATSSSTSAIAASSEVLSIGRCASFTVFPGGWLTEKDHDGKIDELRISDSARYTSNFTPSTVEFTDDANTMLLMHFDSTPIIDSSSQAHTVTVNNSAAFVGSKFGIGSAFFDGTGDYLSIPDHDGFNITENVVDTYTIDCWLKVDNLTKNMFYMSQSEDNSNRWGLNHDGTSAVGLSFIMVSGGITQIDMDSNTKITDKDWHHIVFVKVADVYSLYLDGNQIAYLQDTSIDTFAADLTIGTKGVGLGDDFQGCIDEVRIQKSNPFSATPNVGVTDTIVVPIAEHIADVDTQLLMHLNSEPFTDDSDVGHVINSVNSAKIVIPKFGTGNAHFNGSTQYLTIPDHGGFDIVATDTEDWTIDLWVKHTNLSAQTYICQYADVNNQWALITDGIGIGFVARDSGSNIFFTGYGGTLSNSIWHHVAFCKVADEYAIYIDGVQVNYIQDSDTLNLSAPVYVGSRGGTSGFLDGQMDELRIQKSNLFGATPVVGLSDTITVPTDSSDSNSATKLLMHFDQISSGSTNIVDSAPAPSGAFTKFNGADITVTKSKFGNGSLECDAGLDQHILQENDSPYLTPFNSGQPSFAYTMECWINPTSLTTTHYFMAQAEGPGNSFALGVNPDGTIFFQVRQSGPITQNTVSAPGVITVGNWHHVVYAQKDHHIPAGVAGIYVDGVQVAFETTLVNPSFDFDGLSLGARGPFLQGFHGHIDEVKIQRENYYNISPNVGLTDTLTVPTEAWEAEANDLYLLHLNITDIVDGELEDVSDIGHDVTAVNSTAIASPKFGAGNLRLNGTNQYLTVPDSSDWDVFATTTEDWTIDCWIKSATGNPIGDNIIVSQTDGVSGWTFDLTSVESIRLRFFGAGSFTIQSPISQISDTNYHHVVMIKVANEYGLYLDGVQIAYAINNSIASFSHPLGIGSDSTGSFDKFHGNMDELRIQKSNTFNAVPVVGLTDTITVPTSAHTEDGDTKLLLHFDAYPIIDSSGASHNVTGVNIPELTYSYFGEGSSYFDGAGDFLSMPDSPDWDAFINTTDDYTVDMWVRHETLGSKVGYFVQNDGNNTWGLQKQADDTLNFSVANISFNDNQISTYVIPDNDWHHILMVKKGGSPNYEVGVYVDGVQVIYFTSNITVDAAAVQWIGRNHAGNYFHGNIEETRFQCSNINSLNPNVGLTDTFAVPTEAYSQTGRIIRNQGIIIT